MADHLDPAHERAVEVLMIDHGFTEEQAWTIVNNMLRAGLIFSERKR